MPLVASWYLVLVRESRRVQRRTSVLIRLGTSPTGITAISFSVAASIADTDRAPELETYTTLPSGVNVIHSGTELAGACPSVRTSGNAVYPINFRSGSEYLKVAFARVLFTHNDFPSGATPIPCEGVPVRPSTTP